MAVEAGIITWLKQVKCTGYPNVVAAVFDPGWFDANDMSLWEIVTTIMDEYEGGRKLMIEAGLITASEDEDERGVEVEVDVEVEVGVVDMATAQRAQRALEEAGGVSGLFQGDRFPDESDWTQG